jgi:hypothetical protein
MLIVYGVYKFKPRRVAFRNDYCLTCSQPRRAQQIRTFNAFHIFWIPLIPLGFWKQWLCTKCGSGPHYRRTTRRGFKWVGFALLVLFSVALWVLPVDPEVATGIWVLRAGLPVGAALTLRHLLRTPKDIPLEEQLAAIPPADDTNCPFCRVPLVLTSSGPYCPSCAAVRV